MTFLKKYLKFIIGIAVLCLVLVVFAFSMRSTDNLEMSTLRDWQRAPLERRVAAVQISVAEDTNLELLVQCVDKMATLDGASEMMIRDAVSLCYTGMQMKENL